MWIGIVFLVVLFILFFTSFVKALGLLLFGIGFALIGVSFIIAIILMLIGLIIVAKG